MVYGLHVKIALFNNFSLGMVKQWQTLFYEKRYGGVDLEKVPDYAKLAEAYSCVGITVTKTEEVRPALERAKEVTDRTVLIDFQHDPMEHVYPMIASGLSVEGMQLQ